MSTLHWQLTRAGNVDINPMSVEQRAQAFASGSKSATVITTMDDHQLSHFLSIPYSSSANEAAKNLAHTVAARLNVIDSPPDLSFAPYVAQLRWMKTSATMSATQSGADLTQLSKILGDSMPEGSWVGATTRTASPMERSRWANWLAYRMGQRRPVHHSTKKEAQVVTMWAGGQTPTMARDLAATLAASLPGFDVGTRPVNITPRPLAALLFFVAALLTAAGVFLGDLVDFVAGAGLDSLAAALTGSAPMWFGVGAFFGVLGVGTWTHIIPTRSVRILRGIRRGKLPKARRRIIPPRPPKTVDSHVVDRERREDGGAYPLTIDAFMMGAHMPASIVAPHAGSLSGETEAQVRGVPRSMHDPVGPI
ncbi:MAG TPA: hypothetical protein VK054_11720, partial [Beutenbergiaceae bacterium]|nr:hypothetical protein [Beutenbergiaceae bacterium]